jgi:hypothetical protein
MIAGIFSVCGEAAEEARGAKRRADDAGQMTDESLEHVKA